MAPRPERQREIADFFAAHERDVRESVARRVRNLPAAAVEDACQTAWEKLSRRPDVDLKTTGRAWLVTRGGTRGIRALSSRARGDAGRPVPHAVRRQNRAR